MGTVIDIEGSEHGGVADAHAGDMAGVPRAVTAAVLIADGRSREGDGADDEQVVVLRQRMTARAVAVTKTTVMAR